MLPIYLDSLEIFAEADILRGTKLKSCFLERVLSV